MNITKEQEELGTPITQEEMTANYNAWWDSLTDEDKAKLYKEQEEAESQYINSIPPENL
jgi:hypothetical protein